MIKQLFSFLSGSQDDTAADVDADIRLAAAVLLVEVMMADHHIDDAERHKLAESIQQFLAIDEKKSMELIQEAEQKHEELVSLHELTRVINMNLSQPQKITLVEYMWRISMSDGNVDKYEEHLIRKVSDLLYVSHKDFIRSKHLAQCDI